MIDCNKCNAVCCKHVGVIIIEAMQSEKIAEEIKNNFIAFPHEVNEDGSCSMLKNNRCSVYNDRPVVCNSDYIKENFFKDMNKSMYDLWMKLSCESFVNRFKGESL